MPAPIEFDAAAKAFHWLTFVAVAGLFALGWTMVDLPLGPDKLRLYSWHKWLGVTVFAVTAVRLAWRWTHPAPPLPATMPAIERAVARAVHVLLYAILIAMPLTGWLMSSATGFPVVVFGVLPLPDLVGRDQALAVPLKRAHVSMSLALFGLVVLHALAALRHHFHVKDDVLQRMLPRLRRNR